MGGLNVTLAGGYSNCSDESALGTTTLEVTSDAMAQAIARSPGLRRVRVTSSAGSDTVVDAGSR